MAEKKTPKLPASILVWYDEEGSEAPYLLASTNVDEIPSDMHGKEVGVYRLSLKRKLQIKRTLV